MGDLRYDYAVFKDDRYVNNAMLTRAEAARMEADGFRCIDTEATVDVNLPRFRGRTYVTPRWPDRRSRWD